MPLRPLSTFFCAVALLLPPLPAQETQETKSASATAENTLSVQNNLVMVPAVVYDKKGLVKDLTKESFALTVDGKPQTIRYFDRDTDVPLTVGLLVDVSRSQSSVLDEEEKASQSFLQSMLAPGSGSRPADKAFVMQFARTAELLQDVTDSRSQLQAGLKEIGTQAPGSTDDDAADTSNNGNGNGNGGNGNGGNNGGYPGYGRGGGYPGGNGNGNGNGGNNSGSSRSRSSGTVLYDALFLSSDDVMGKQTGRRALIVLTDGVDRHSKESLTEAIEAAQRANTVVYAIYYKGEDRRGFSNGYPGGGYPGGGYPGYGGGYPGYGGGNYPGSGGRPGSDGTYAEPDGRKILQRICGETGGQMFEVKGKGSVDKIYGQIGDELRAGYRLGFTPTDAAAASGYHKLQLTMTSPDARKDEVQTRDGFYASAAKASKP